MVKKLEWKGALESFIDFKLAYTPGEVLVVEQPEALNPTLHGLEATDKSSTSQDKFVFCL